ncbi:MAG TPA: gluconate 2-dehydrogenase subunit 3 family protein [Rhodothermales bacterium]|nr:gluconate 2-dehydrogenase subunit 3 family protein [Rhodothermales bacterium]
MAQISRRESLKMMALAPLASGFSWAGSDVDTAHRKAAAAIAQGGPFKPSFFTDHEFQTVRVLADIVIPKDERSGSATDVGVPEFMDFMMLDQDWRQTGMRGGLAWLDAISIKRYGKTFVDATEAERISIVDDIAYPEHASPDVSQGVAFFNSFRDLTATGFWTSREGIDDIQYLGNTVVPEWTGCPEEALKKIGVENVTLRG